VRTAPWDEPGKELLIVGGEDHKTGKRPAGDPFANLENWTRVRFPMVERFVQGWSGEVMETMDGLGLIGRLPGEQRLYAITGDSGMGMTHGTLGGMLIADLIAGEANAWASLYEPSRKRPMATGGFFRETFDMVRQVATRRLEGPEVESAQDIPRDHGAVMHEGRDKVAVYRGPSGELHRMSAACTHLGCIVAWNDTEKTWDCPCHGSRFDRFGKAIHGPAVHDLKLMDGVASEKR
jgi:Rieske Fe-S protein